MSHIVQMSNTNGPDPGQNGLSSAAKHGLISEWYSAVANTVCWSLELDSVRTASRWVRHVSRVDRRRRSNDSNEALSSVDALTSRSAWTSRWRFVRAPLDASQGEPDPQLDGLAGLGRPAQQQSERPQRRRADRVEVEPGRARDQPAVVPELLAPVAAIPLEVDGEWCTLHGDLAVGNPRFEQAHVGSRRDGHTVVDEQTTVRQIDDDPRIASGRGTCSGGRHSSVRPSARRARRSAGSSRSSRARRSRVPHRPQRPERVQRLEHRGDPDVVVVLADRTGARLAEVREPGRNETIVERVGDALGRQLVQAVARRVRAGVRAHRCHPQRERRAGMGVADRRLRPPPRGGEPFGRWQIGDVGPDERVDGVDRQSTASLSPGCRAWPGSAWPASACAASPWRACGSLLACAWLARYGCRVPRLFRPCERSSGTLMSCRRRLDPTFAMSTSGASATS